MPSIANIIGAIIARSGGKNDLAASVNALVEERRKSRESGIVDIKISQ